MAANGYDVLRFDYYGTGDSAGASEEVTFRGCVDDTLSAVEEVCALANVRRVVLVGLRLGAAIADRAAAEARAVDRLILWDPVSDGSDYLDELRAIAADRPARQASRDLHGFPLHGAVEAELRTIGPESFATGRTRHILLIASEERDEHVRLLDRLKRVHDDAEWGLHRAPRSWVEEGNLGAGAIPVDILDHITTWKE